MKTGEIILVPFPFAELTVKKVRPAVIIAETKDKYRDVIVCAISSVVSFPLSQNEFTLEPTSINNLRARSVVKVDRIVTTKLSDVIDKLGKLSTSELRTFKEKFKKLIDEL
ncbi:MAG: type II toxin-antitoxin system PemK/MazF family toxin [Ignavibacteriales bacterium]|nr:type II toxin-antitoxin system PemK/MazF family toxin [Ignavibacteriales bacterium]